MRARRTFDGQQPPAVDRSRQASRGSTAPVGAEAILRLQSDAGNAAVVQRMVVQREWVGGDEALLYRAATGNDFTFGVPRYTRITVLDKTTGPRWKVRVGKTPSPYDTKVNFSRFELQHQGTEGWMEPSVVSDRFPYEDNFQIPNEGQSLPPLYHGSDRESIETIKVTGFVVKPSPVAGRSYGDGVYATPYVTKAAVHGAGAAEQTLRKPRPTPEFAVGVIGEALYPPRKPKILVHDQLREMALGTEIDPTMKPFERAREVVVRLHGATLADTASALVPPQERDFGITKTHITAAARVHGYDVVAYTGHPGDSVYVLLRSGDWRIKRTILEAQVTEQTGLSHPEDLDWFHEASDLDRNQAAMNQLAG